MEFSCNDPRIIINCLLVITYFGRGSYGHDSSNGGSHDPSSVYREERNSWLPKRYHNYKCHPQSCQLPSSRSMAEVVAAEVVSSAAPTSSNSDPAVASSVVMGREDGAPVLYTKGRWIVDKNGERVKLTCINWPSHVDASVAEGLNHQPVDKISKMIISMGFNCVRFTWPVYLATNNTLANMTTLKQSFESHGLTRFIPGVEANNPSFVDLPLIMVFQAVAKSLADNNLMIILDNHVSKPMWCCGDSDGNGFFGDRFFDPEEWIRGLTNMATMFKGSNSRNVVAMSLRNELRGPRQNVNDWYKYMQRGAEAVHAANPDVLVILSGLSYDLDLSFLQTRQVNLSFINKNKVVFEFHWYSFSGGRGAWINANPNDVCGRVTERVKNRALFLLPEWPLMLTEFGINVMGTNMNDNRYLNCLLTVVAEYDLDWAYWAIGGSYYLRMGVIGLNETYGLLTPNWELNETLVKTGYMQRLSAIQTTFQGPTTPQTKSKEHQIIFHPLTGLCVQMKSLQELSLKLDQCANSSDFWSYETSLKTLKLTKKDGNIFSLQAEGINKPAKLIRRTATYGTSYPVSQWQPISNSKLHLSTMLNNSTLCLDVADHSAIIMTNTCKCLTIDKTCDPAHQWFKLVNVTMVDTKRPMKLR